MKMRKFAGFMLAGTMLLSTLSGCGSTIVDQAGSAGAESAASSEQTQSTEDKTDLTEKVSLKINYAAGNKSRTITYNQAPCTPPVCSNPCGTMWKRPLTVNSPISQPRTRKPLR